MSRRASHEMFSSVSLRCLLLLVALCSGVSALAQQANEKANGSAVAATHADGPSIESDPLRCWLKSTKTSVHIGEQFNVALTCAVIEASRAVVVPDVSQIEPASIQMAPFEVLSGRKHPEIKSGMWRYFQYEYTVRLIADGFFGQDLAIPPISISYRVNMLGAGAAQEGREKAYVLPQLPIRIVSLVPTIATDIRDAPRGTFADIAQRTLRANVAFVLAGILYAFAAVLIVIVLVRAFSGLRKRRVATPDSMSTFAVTGAALGALQKVAVRRAKEGWTPELISQGVAVARIAGAIALDKPVAQQVASHDAVLQEGQVLVSRGPFKQGALLVSAAVTPRSLVNSAKRFTWPDRAPLYAQTSSALTAFSEARYMRVGAANQVELDTAMDEIRAILRQLRLQLSWPVRAIGGLLYWWHSRRGPGWAR
jgi:hypothetical protein